MISKLAIEKAIAGGWNFKGEQPDEVKQFGEVEIAYAMWESVALDATFWQALGKALGWDEGKRYELGYAEFAEGGLRWMWEFIAHRFYDLILQGSDTTEFWSDLLSDKQ